MKTFYNTESLSWKLLIIESFIFFNNFLLIPIIVIFFNNQLNFSAFQIGFLIALPSIISSFLSRYSHLLCQKIGIYKTLVISLFLDALFISFLIFFSNYYFILIGAFIQGIGKCLWEPTYKTLYLQSLKDKNNTKILFKIRYIFICVTAIFAPILSTFIYSFFVDIIFILIIINILICFFFLRFSKFLLETVNNYPEKKTEKKPLNKKFIFFYLVGSILILTVFSQFESTFSLTIVNKVENPVFIFTYLLILNSIFGIIFQIIGLSVFKHMSTIKQILLGSLFFAISFFGFSLEIINIYYFTIVILFFTVAETILLPNLDILISEISNEENRNYLFGVAEFKKIGFILGPLLSSAFIEIFNPHRMFLYFMIFSLLSFFAFYIIKRIKL
ncbi:MAG: MFS transporter [Fusobacteriaceae bacterium]